MGPRGLRFAKRKKTERPTHRPIPKRCANPIPKQSWEGFTYTHWIHVWQISIHLPYMDPIKHKWRNFEVNELKICHSHGSHGI